MEIIFKAVPSVGSILAVFLGLVLYLPTLSIVVRRLWDAGRSSYLAVIPAVLAIGAVYEGFFEWSLTGLFIFLYLLTLTIIGILPTAGETTVPEEQPA